VRDFDPANVRLGSKAALWPCRLNVRISPESGRIADIGGLLKSAISCREQMQQTCAENPDLLDHLIGAGKQRRWDVEAERLGGC
jgi:hypothetical protein